AAEREADPMRLLARDDGHAPERGGKRSLLDDRDLVVVPRDHLLVIRIRPLDQPSEDPRPAAAETEVVLAPRDLDLVVRAEEALDLLERLRRDDQVHAR